MIDKAMAKEQVSELVEILRYNAESENFYHTVFETIGIAILILDKNNNILRANGEFERLTGYTREEVEGKRKWTEVTARKDDLERMKEYNRLRHINPLSAPRTYGFQFVDRQGQAKDVVLTVAVMPGTKKSLAVMVDVTEQKRMEAALQESEQRLADTIDFLPDATFAVDLTGKVIAWNRAIEEMTGVKAAEILGKGDYEYTQAFYSMRRPMLIDLVFNPDADIKAIYDFVTRDEKVFLAETHVTLRGVDRALWGKAGPLYNSNGAIVGAIETVRDITGRRQTEVALRESERRLADIIDFLPDATFAVDLTGKVIAWNRAIEEMTGVKAAEILGKDDYEYTQAFYGTRRPMLIDLVFGSDAEIEKRYDFIKREGNVLLAEVNVPSKGMPRFLWGKAGPLYDSNGAIVGAIESVRDITERRKTKEDLQKAHDELEARVRERTAELMQVNRILQAEIAERKRAEEKILILANLSDISPLSITVHDLQGNFLYANQKTFDMHGYSKEEFLALNVRELDLPASAALFEERLKEILAAGEAKFDVEHYRKGGACLPLEVFVKATQWENQTVLLSVASDVTERRRNEEELKKYRKDLEVLVAERTAELEDKTKNLQEMNTALNVLLQKREKDKEILEENFVANIGSLVLPYVEKLRKNNLDMQQQFCLDIIEKHLGEIASPLLNNIRRYDLTPREIQIASLIKDGKTTKEISKTLGIGEGSIDTHRKNIRKKLGLDRASNLQSHLRFLEKNR
jgi:PAS domain S-box-containing protein